MSALIGGEITRDLDLNADVCVIGSGAGGSVLAAGLCEQGLQVVMLEAGPRVSKADFTLREADAYPTFYQDQGLRLTSDGAISILQGRTVGGSTTVNWTTCFRTPNRILEVWRSAHGVEGLDEASLAPHFDAVEARLNIHRWEVPPNTNNQLLLTGAQKLGWQADITRRNVKGCANSGFCGLGCPVDGKQAMHVTYLPDALAAGLQLYSGVQVDEIVHQNGKASAVIARTDGGARLTVRPRVVAVCGGAINTPVLLLRSGIQGPVGRRTFLHPAVVAVGEHTAPVLGYFGAPQSAACHEFVDRGADRVGFFMEAAPVQPLLVSLIGSRLGPQAADLMRRMPHLAGHIALAVDGLHPGADGGTVSLRRDGRFALDYPVGPALVEAMREAHLQLVRGHVASGAAHIYTAHAGADNAPVAEAEALLGRLRYGAFEHTIVSAHVMGGCAMGADPARSVVDNQHRVHGFGNLFVVDGSVFPSALGVNPSETIYGLAHRARPLVAAAV